MSNSGALAASKTVRRSVTTQGQKLQASSGPAILPALSKKPGHSMANWKDMVTPETTPSAKLNAKTFTQN